MPIEVVSSVSEALSLPMLDGLGVIGDLTLAIVAALVFGSIAVRLGQPPLMGYLLAGVVVGPFALGLVRDLDSVQSLAELGVAFLMFVLAVELSIQDLRRVWAVAVIGGTIQILVTILIVIGVAQSVGLDLAESALLGCIVSLSSTTVVLKILADRDEIDTLQGRILTGMLIVQDLSVVPMVVILPALGAPSSTMAYDLLVAVVKAAVVLSSVLYLGTRLVPRLLLRIAAAPSRELFLLSVVALILGTAIVAYVLGLSVAFGAFIAGLVVSESYLSYEILSELRPLRDIFATIFFLSVGMLVNPSFITANLTIIALIVLAIVILKFLLGTAITLSFRYSASIAVAVGLGLIQIGEFSFVLARLGVEQGMLSDFLYSLTLTVALITILLTSWSLRLAAILSGPLAKVPGITWLIENRNDVAAVQRVESLTQHIVLCGYGRSGRVLAQMLAARGFKYFVIDYDPYVVDALRSQGVPSIYGDASHRPVLAQANLGKARALIVSIPDAVSAELAIRNALAINPKLDIISKANRSWAVRLLRNAGATEIVQPEFEAGLEMVRHALHRYGISSLEIQALMSRLRETYYQTAEDTLPYE